MQSDGSVRLQKGVFGSSVQKKIRKKAIVFAFLHQRWLRVGAADEARTRYLHLGKVALYQMSYGRILITLFCVIGAPAKICEAKVCGEKEKVSQDFRRGASDRNRTNDTGIFSPLLYRLSYRGAPDDDYYTRNSGFVKRKLQIFLKKIRLFLKKAFERGIL